ncbi:MAG: hypothetical protein ACOCXH_09835 [Cyclobacteriaceae bacterium]
MKRVEAIKEGFYFTDGEKIIKIIGEFPNRPDFYRALTEDEEEIKIRKEKLFKVRLNDNWLKDLGYKEGESIYKDEQTESFLKKSGPSFHIEERTGSDKKRKMVLSVDELQNYIFEKTGKVPEV